MRDYKLTGISIIQLPKEFTEQEVEDTLETIRASVDSDIYKDLSDYIDYLVFWKNYNSKKEEKLEKLRVELQELLERNRF